MGPFKKHSIKNTALSIYIDRQENVTNNFAKRSLIINYWFLDQTVQPVNFGQRDTNTETRERSGPLEVLRVFFIF